MNYIVELGKDANEHELVNSCALYLWQEVFKYDTRFYGSVRHKNALKSLIPELNISSFEPIEILPRKDGSKMNWVKIYLHEVVTVFRILKKAKREKVTNIVFLSLSSPTMFFVKQYLRISRLQANIFFTLHGELQWLIQDNLGSSERFFKSLIRKNLSVALSNEYFVVYGQTIKDKLLTIYTELKDHVLSLEHPFIPSKELLERVPNIFTIGAFGVISKNKNSHEVIKLAEIMQYRNALVQFKLVGKFIDDLAYNKEFITVIGGKEFLARQDYEKEIEDTAWLMYLYEDCNYELIASGAFLDAILYSKPIICLKNRFFQNLFSAYEIGVMVDTIAELPDALDKLFQRTDLDHFYEVCRANLKRYSDDHGLAKQVAVLSKQLKELKNE